jgi:rubrerythrin
MKLCDYPLRKIPKVERATAWPSPPPLVPVPKVKEQSHRKTKFRQQRVKRVKIGWMENQTLEVGEYHCQGCKQHFFFLSYQNTTDNPEFCPLCGKPRKK